MATARVPGSDQSERFLTSLHPDVHDHALQLRHGEDGLFPAQAAHTATLAGVTAERNTAIPVGGAFVHVHHPALQSFGAVESPAEATRVDGAAQTEPTGVGHGDRLVDVFGRDDR